MKIKVICRICGDERIATSKNFPGVLRDKKDNRIIGYICKKHAKEKSRNKPLTRRDMEKLPYGGLPKKYQPRSKYSPNAENKKTNKENSHSLFKSSFLP